VTIKKVRQKGSSQTTKREEIKTQDAGGRTELEIFGYFRKERKAIRTCTKGTVAGFIGLSEALS